MHRVDVDLAGRRYAIQIGPGLLDRLGELVAQYTPTSILVVTNDVVGPLYGARTLASLSAVAPTGSIQLPDGESTKDWDSARRILEALFEHGADRRSLVIALGGGVIGDLAGFAASIYMRGVRVIQVPTTLLAQVDSSIGGKTGVNHSRGKNLIGSFHQPSLVVSDTRTLDTLPSRELSAGLAEMLKHGLLADAAYFEQLVADLDALRRRDHDALVRAIARSCEIKAAIVARDERESGERALLNLGHTFAHAIETLTGYERWLHGEAVGCGLVLAADLSHRLGSLSGDDVRRIAAAVAAAGLPPRIAGLSAAAAMESMRGDKKAERGHVRYVVLERIGRAVQRLVPDGLVLQTLHAGGFG